MDLSNRLVGPYEIPADLRIPFPYNPREHVFGLHSDILSCLRVVARAYPPPGQKKINATEDFKVKVSGSNIAPERVKWNDPYIIFVDPVVWVQGTEYAKVKNPNYWNMYRLNLPDTRLYPGESSIR